MGELYRDSAMAVGITIGILLLGLIAFISNDSEIMRVSNDVRKLAVANDYRLLLAAKLRAERKLCTEDVFSRNCSGLRWSLFGDSLSENELDVIETRLLDSLEREIARGNEDALVDLYTEEGLSDTRQHESRASYDKRLLSLRRSAVKQLDRPIRRSDLRAVHGALLAEGRFMPLNTQRASQMFALAGLTSEMDAVFDVPRATRFDLSVLRGSLLSANYDLHRYRDAYYLALMCEAGDHCQRLQVDGDGVVRVTVGMPQVLGAKRISEHLTEREILDAQGSAAGFELPK